MAKANLKDGYIPTSREKWMVEHGAATPVDDATPKPKPVKTPKPKPVKFVAVWHEIENSENSNRLGVSKLFPRREAAEKWLDDTIAEDVGNARERGNKITVTWDDGIVLVNEDGGAEVTYQVVVLTNDD